jgi:hypothetical protein
VDEQVPEVFATEVRAAFKSLRWSAEPGQRLRRTSAAQGIASIPNEGATR